MLKKSSAPNSKKIKFICIKLDLLSFTEEQCLPCFFKVFYLYLILPLFNILSFPKKMTSSSETDPKATSDIVI